MKIAVVTGASSGIGREFAVQIDREERLDEIWVAARSEQKLETLKRELKTPVRVVKLDVTDRAMLEGFAALLNAEKPDIRVLVNSAGFGKFCAYDEVDIDTSLAMVETNCAGLLAVTLTCLPHMGRGARIINMGSASSFQPLPYVNVYAATKAFVRHYSRALNVELKPRGISVTAVCPYWVDTGFFDIAHDTKGGAKVTEHKPLAAPRKVVAKALRDSEKKKDMSVYGAVNKVQHVAAKLAPQRLTMSVFMKMQGIKQKESGE